MATRIALVGVENDAATVRDLSDCGQVRFDNCDNEEIDEQCGADALNAGIAQAIPDDGLGFDGLDESEDAIPVLLMFWDNDEDGTVTCTSDQLFACGALDLRIPGEEAYDLVCSSCQNGPAATVETAPCFTPCFLSLCADFAQQFEEMDAG